MTVHETDRLTGLGEAWRSPRSPLDRWVRDVSTTFQASGMRIDAAADQIDVTPAELEAVIRLDALDEPTLRLVASADPPSTTWMLLAEVPAGEVRSALRGLEGRPHGTAFESVRSVLRDLVGVSPAERVTVLDASFFRAAAAKGAHYAVWPRTGGGDSKHVKALKSFASRRSSGRPLTPKQAVYALGLLRELVESRAVQVPSLDGDDEVCRAIIEAI